MTKTTVVTALRFALSLSMAGPAHAWTRPADAAPTEIASVRRASPHLHDTKHAAVQHPSTARLPDREEDPLSMMHFE